MEWRNRVTGPSPGNSPKNVGDVDTEYFSRLVCLTNFVPDRSVRRMNGDPSSTFTIWTLGVMFQLPWKRLGSSMPVSQFTPVWYVRSNTRDCLTVSSPPPAFGTTDSTTRVSGKSFSASCSVNELRQLNPKMRSGELKLID